MPNTTRVFHEFFPHFQIHAPSLWARAKYVQGILAYKEQRKVHYKQRAPWKASVLSELFQKRFPQGEGFVFIMWIQLHYLKDLFWKAILQYVVYSYAQGKYSRVKRLLDRGEQCCCLRDSRTRRHNLDKAAHALKLQNIRVVKSQRLHRAPPSAFCLGDTHFSSLLIKLSFPFI